MASELTMLLRKMAAMLKRAEEKQKLKGIPNPGAAPKEGIPNPVASYANPSPPLEPGTGTEEDFAPKSTGWTPKIPTHWSKL